MEFTRRLFLKRAGQMSGVFVLLPVAKAIGKATSATRHHHHHVRHRHHHDPAGYFEHTILAMGTTARIGVYASSEEEANHVITAAFAELKRLEALFTVFDASSEISKLNTSAGGPLQPCSTDTYSILQSAKNYSGMTGAAFDATVEPLMELWGFRSPSKELKALPTKEEIATALRWVGSEHIEIGPVSNAPSARLNVPGAKLDLGSIAMGYAIDRMVSILRAEGIEHAFIDISGDMYAMGTPKGLRHGNNGWAVAIPDPRDSSRMIHWTAIMDQALSTAGNYESFVVYQAQKFGHIMDPREGRSANRTLSATVIAKTGTDADALSTASFVTGERYGETKLILVDHEGKIGTTG
ncbi:MAG TPA: FAD:protein FMN transferase [Candidatus Kapabacteria bacterium]|nr:FAD:protein FMN transferase [Candidatus Kapabacteria bacterium]